MPELQILTAMYCVSSHEIEIFPVDVESFSRTTSLHLGADLCIAGKHEKSNST